jgi:hypothetical protein
MNRALIKGNGDQTQLGGPDEPACDFERPSLRGDAGAGTQLAPSVGQRFGDRVYLIAVASAMVFFGLVDDA